MSQLYELNFEMCSKFKKPKKNVRFSDDFSENRSDVVLVLFFIFTLFTVDLTFDINIKKVITQTLQ